MEAISYLIGPLGMIKSVNLNWATYSPGIKYKKQQAVRETLEGEEGSTYILICS